MTSTLTRITALALTLAALLLLSACSRIPDPNDDPGYILNQSNAETPADEITAFYNGNVGTLQTLAAKLTKAGTYTAYSYSYRMTDYEEGTLEFYVQKQEKANGIWADCTDEDATRLSAVKFVGTVTYDPTVSKSTVVFNPRMATSEKSLSLVYCAGDEDKALVERGAYHKDCTVTLTEVAKNWYCAEAVKNAE